MKTPYKHAPLRRYRLSVHRGFTLVELVAAMAVMIILMLGMGSTMIIATRAIPDGKSSTEIAADSRNVLDRMTEDLLYTTSVTEKTTNAITFTVADRGHGAAGPETIRYAWSGTPGDPLTLEYNGAVAATLVDDVQEFALTYTTKASAPQAGPAVEGPEEVFLSQDATNSGSSAQFDVSGSGGAAEYFEPTLPGDAISWRITRVAFVAAPKKPTNATLSVSVRQASGTGVPTGLIVDQVQVPEANLLAGNWHQVTFSSAGGLDPSQAYCIAWTGDGGSVAGKLSIGTGSVGSPQTKYFVSSDGIAWTEDPTVDIWMVVMGTVTAPDPNPPQSASGLLSSIRVELQISADTSTRVQTEVQTLNEPDVGAL
ncbi:MAG: prepilin-type N-terminal cleavage/methylation domain-containing protein [Planctomycetes bacterium]|nr:prepilin-type N-terminal cleavage/methylation domain-containing protein [Planctomycetota bacterium]